MGKVDANFFAGVNIKSTRPTVVLFFSHGCGHCRHLMPTWERFERNSSIPTAALDVNSLPSGLFSLLSSKLFRGVPTVWLYLEGKPYMEYKGDRSYESLMSFASNRGNIKFEKVGK